MSLWIRVFCRICLIAGYNGTIKIIAGICVAVIDQQLTTLGLLRYPTNLGKIT